jgi:predicted ester cyclase
MYEAVYAQLPGNPHSSFPAIRAQVLDLSLTINAQRRDLALRRQPDQVATMTLEDERFPAEMVDRTRNGDQYRELYASYLQHCNAHNFEAMQSFYSSPTVQINDEPWTPEKVTAQFAPLVSVFPDWHWEMRNLAVDGDFLALHFKVSGTHQGAFQGVEATGRTVNVSQFTLYHVVDGKFAEVWDLIDMQAILKQIM